MASLWLVPEAAEREPLARLIEELARRLAAPAFPPHLTLFSSLRGDELAARSGCAELARGLRPMSLRFEQATHSEQFFRCVVLEARPTPELLGAHQKAHRLFRDGPDRFRPHLSLVYGWLPVEQRAEVAEEVRRRLELPLELRAERLELHDTSGRPRRWRRRAVWMLSPAASG